MAIRRKNKKAVQILNKWFAEKDSYGGKFWLRFYMEISKNPFDIGKESAFDKKYFYSLKRKEKL